jgi:hypothetical protein
MMVEITLPSEKIPHDTGYTTGSPEALDRLRQGFELERAWGTTATGELSSSTPRIHRKQKPKLT